jgi:hypothetical protein
MRTDHSLKQNQSKPILDRPVLAAMAVAVFGVLAMLIVDHGPWNRPQLQTAEDANGAQAGARTESARAETRSTGKSRHALGGRSIRLR